jgi:SAM-dependent methyltransferase
MTASFYGHQRFIQIDEEGYFKMDQLRVADAEAGREWLANLSIDEQGRAWVSMNQQRVLVEAFDEPYIALDIEKPSLTEASWIITMPYGHRETTRLDTLTVDEWDRFHGRTERGVPFVLSRSAQARFFDLLDSFDDDSITFAGETIEMRPWLRETNEINDPSWWTDVYVKENAPWDLGAPSLALTTSAPQLKLTKCRVLVLGAGSGNDAAWFAEQGHIVTAMDFSEEAVARAKAKYGHLPTLTIEKRDVFELPSSMNGSFDLVFEHTLYCAISPARRPELVKVWRRVLADHGHLMGVFFTMDKLKGPPYGASEWEIRARLEKGFRPLYWNRLKESGRENRLGLELFVYAQKLPAF